MPKDFAGVMKEWKTGNLHSGSKSGPKVSNQKQAVAIAFSEQRQQKKASARTARTDAGHFDGKPAPAGSSGWKHKPKVLNNPKTLTGRRNASRSIAYPD